MPDLLPGAEIAGCRIEAIAGRGGMGIVYRATQLSLGRPVALKLIAPERAADAGFRERFERESRLAAAIDHPNVIPVYGAGEEAGHLYLVMRYVAGTDLQALLARDRYLEPARAAAIVGQVAAALDAAHAAGLVHRDVKPANVLLGGEHAYLADFGLTRVAMSDERMTTTGHWLGTVDYMAPEQFEGGAVDARADVYALGCVLYTTLTGETPFPRGTVPATMLAHLGDPPPRPSTSPGVPEGFDRVIARALAKRPADRYPSAGDLARAAQGTAEGRPVTASERMVARGAAAPAAAANGRAHGNQNGNGNGFADAPTVVLGAPPRTERVPGVTLPLGDRPRRRGRRLVVAGGVALAAAAGAAAVAVGTGDGIDAAARPGAPVARGEVAALARAFAAAYAAENAAALQRILSRDAERVLPNSRQQGRAAVVAAYRGQFDGSETRDFQLEDLRAAGGGTGRATARYRVRYRGESDVTGTIILGVRRERGTPRIALVAATPDG